MLTMNRMCKILLVSFLVFSAIDVEAQRWAEQPQLQMHSTSTMQLSESLLPQAAKTGVSTTASSLYSMGEDEPFNQHSGPKRARPDDWDDPYKNPVGDIPWVMMVACVGIYILVLHHKHRVNNTVK
jgi:hypothetical protein